MFGQKKTLNKITQKKESEEKKLKNEFANIIQQVESNNDRESQLSRKRDIIEIQLQILEEASKENPETQWSQDHVMTVFNTSRDNLFIRFQEDYKNALEYREQRFVEGKLLPMNDYEREKLFQIFPLTLQKEKKAYTAFEWKAELSFQENISQNIDRLRPVFNNTQEEIKIISEKNDQLTNDFYKKNEEWCKKAKKLSKKILAQQQTLAELFTACKNNDPQLVYRLIQVQPEKKRTAYLSQFDHEGNSPLHIACENDFYLLSETLMNHNVNPNISNKYGYKPMHLAAKSGHLSIIELLKNKEAHISATGEYGRTVLDMAVYYGNLPIVNYLLNQGAFADPITTKEGGYQTPLQVAAFTNKPKIAATLLEHGANPQQCNPLNETPLMEAIHDSHTRIVEVFTNFYLQEYKRLDEITDGFLDELIKCAKNSVKPDSMVPLMTNFKLNVSDTKNQFQLQSQNKLKR